MSTFSTTSYLQERRWAPYQNRFYPLLVLVDGFHIRAFYRKSWKIVIAWCPLNCLIIKQLLQSCPYYRDMEIVVQCCRNWSYSCSTPLTELLRMSLFGVKCFHCFQQRSIWLRPLGSSPTVRPSLHFCSMWESHIPCFIDAFKRPLASGDWKQEFTEPFLLRLYASIHIIFPSPQNAHRIQISRNSF